LNPKFFSKAAQRSFHLLLSHSQDLYSLFNSDGNLRTVAWLSGLCKQLLFSKKLIGIGDRVSCCQVPQPTYNKEKRTLEAGEMSNASSKRFLVSLPLFDQM
jgi:hypothetical protein